MSRLLPLADPWFRRTRIDATTTLVDEPHVHRMLRCNVWHVRRGPPPVTWSSTRGLGLASLRVRCSGDPLRSTTSWRWRRTSTPTMSAACTSSPAERSMPPRPTPSEPGSVDTRSGTTRVPVRHDLTGRYAGYDTRGRLVDAVPRADLAARIPPTPARRPPGLLKRATSSTSVTGRSRFSTFRATHPAASGCGRAQRVLFSGDAVYDGLLLDEIEGKASIDAYVATMTTIRRPARGRRPRRARCLDGPPTIHRGHRRLSRAEASTRTAELIDQLLKGRHPMAAVPVLQLGSLPVGTGHFAPACSGPTVALHREPGRHPTRCRNRWWPRRPPAHPFGSRVHTAPRARGWVRSCGCRNVQWFRAEAPGEHRRRS